jgi:hypothetical protein
LGGMFAFVPSLSPILSRAERTGFSSHIRPSYTPELLDKSCSIVQLRGSGDISFASP